MRFLDRVRLHILMKRHKGKRPLTVFFDVDGVLNRESDWSTPFLLNEECMHNFGKLDLALKENKYLPNYVICSTWRAGKDLWGNENADQYDRLTELLAKEGIKIAGATPVTDKGRQAEIDYYIRRNHIYDYIVIDDDIYLYMEPTKIRIFVPDFRSGLKESDIELILWMLAH